MKRLLATAGAVALLAWTGLGLIAWMNVAKRITITSADAERPAQPPSELLSLADEVGALHQDVRALAKGFGESLQALHDELAAKQDEHAAAIELQVAALRDEAGSRTTLSPSSADELAGLLRRLEQRFDALDASLAAHPATQFVPPSTTELVASAPLESELAVQAEAPAAELLTVAAPEVVPTPAPLASAPTAPAKKKSFLAFQLPSDDFRFDERRTWSVLPALSRVGFDAKTTLHDFSGVTSALEGELEADLSKPGEKPRARLTVQAAKLASGDEDRDEAMREHLAVADHPTIEFELTRFEPGAIDVAAQRGAGTAHGRMTIRGKTHEVSMPVKLSLDDARRLCVEGEMMLDLETFEVPVPNKLGLITMEKDVKVWLSLRLRANPRSGD
ncbi:MAG: hypothetical protein EXS08_06640 [Planctomycetes bacterium]|nr:hypothetical protein [Planctomycetota bacterium]